MGVSQGWELESFELDAVLPGSLDTNGIGTPNLTEDYLGGLSRKVHYTGPAWFSRSIFVPTEWLGKPLVLNLERVHWFSRVYINGQFVGGSDSLSVQHTFTFTPDENALLYIIIRVDNTVRIPVGRIGHAVTDWTQTNWNGFIGDISLSLVEEAPLGVTTLSTSDGLIVRGTAPANKEVSLSFLGYSVTTQSDSKGSYSAHIDRTLLPVWSDESPETFDLTVRSGSRVGGLKTGYRRFVAAGRLFHLNDQPTFLRGTLDACVFPKTGFPPTETAPWLEILSKVKEFGLNHVRFHSWCPPEAAFVAADSLGVLLQVECPLWTGTWSLSSDECLLSFIRSEAFRILSTYGHHPSFVLFTLGNEMSFYGPEPEVDLLLRDLKAEFPHILFNFSSHGTHLSQECDFYVQADNGKPGLENQPLRGSTWFGVGSRFDRESPGTLTNCNAASAEFDRPVIAHEVAEWAVFPNVNAQSDYDGVLEARNFAAIQKGLKRNGMESQADDFVQASGKLSATLYKEEIECLMRTKDLAGYQLLGLSDFPGQGTATIGMLDAFWKEKGFIDGTEFRKYCSSTIPLLETERFVWTSGEEFCGEASVSNFGPEGVLEVTWELQDSEGALEASGSLGLTHLMPGTRSTPQLLRFPLDMPGPGKYRLVVKAGESAVNDWQIWVFPKELPSTSEGDLQIFSWFRNDVREALRDGKTVWLRMNPSRTWSGIAGRYAPAFWSPIHFVDQVGTMGTLIQETHPIFRHFPTESFTEWHWWEILTRSKATILNALPEGFKPILQVMDRYERNHKLGSIWEAQVGAGRLFVTFIDFDTPGRPAAHQLEFAIREYLASDLFKPVQSVSLDELDLVFASDP